VSNSAEGVRVAYPLFQVGGGGSTPTSALQLTLDTMDFRDAKKLNALWHSRLPEFGTGCIENQPFLCFGAEFDGRWWAVAIWSNPVARLLPQRRWLELRRLAIAPDAPRNTASRMLGIMARIIREQRPEVCRLISYQDTDVHTGAIYRAAGWRKAYPRQKSNTKWNMPGRRRPASQSDAPKQRWEKVMHKDIKWTELNPPEKSRTYHFANGDKVTFSNVVRIEVRESGTHRIETANGSKAFVRPEWLWLEIDTPEWSF
jgi:hypothetical protein